MQLEQSQKAIAQLQQRLLQQSQQPQPLFHEGAVSGGGVVIRNPLVTGTPLGAGASAAAAPPPAAALALRPSIGGLQGPAFMNMGPPPFLLQHRQPPPPQPPPQQPPPQQQQQEVLHPAVASAAADILGTLANAHQLFQQGEEGEDSRARFNSGQSRSRFSSGYY